MKDIIWSEAAPTWISVVHFVEILSPFYLKVNKMAGLSVECYSQTERRHAAVLMNHNMEKFSRHDRPPFGLLRRGGVQRVWLGAWPFKHQEGGLVSLQHVATQRHSQGPADSLYIINRELNLGCSMLRVCVHMLILSQHFSPTCIHVHAHTAQTQSCTLNVS